MSAPGKDLAASGRNAAPPRPGRDAIGGAAGKKTFLLRVSPEMYKEIEKLAAAEFRSVNGQIEYLLHDALRRRGRGGKDAAA